jgi:acyl-CoA synthetase (NDP forming)
MSLERVMNPRSVAVVGASRNPTKRGFKAVKTLLEEKFEGAVYPVNPSEDSILGLPCFKTVSDIPGPVDLVVITTPARTVPGIIEECAARGVAGAVVIAGGFREAGADGASLEERLVAAARNGGVRIIGPNTSGMMSLRNHMDIIGFHQEGKGELALLSQSGNMALALFTEARVKSRKAFGYYVGVGNEADIRFHEYLAFFEQDPDVKVIVMYVEGMREGRKFLQQAHSTTRHKPLVLLKGGRSAAGTRSAGSHTGALAGMSEVARSAFRRAGIVVVENSDELFPVAETLASLPPIQKGGVAILADGGGHATIAADVLTDLDVPLATLTKSTRDRLRSMLPAGAAVDNPVDVAGGADSDPEVLADCARLLMEDEQVGCLLVVGLFGGYGIRFAESLRFPEEDAAHRMGKMVRELHKPLVLHSLYSFARPHALDLLRYYNVPVHDSVEVACRCVGVLAEYGSYLQTRPTRPEFVFEWGKHATKRGQQIIRRALKEGRTALLEPEAKELLRLHGAPVAFEALATTEDEAVRLAEEIGGEVALKIVSPDILHKSEARGVALGLDGEKGVRAAFRRIMKSAAAYKPDARLRGVLVSPMAEIGLEVIIGTKVDDQFGPVLMFGIGGIMVEVLKDVSFRVLPISKRATREMIDEIKSVALLNSFRGHPPRDKRSIGRLLLTVSEIVEAYPEIREMDLNPVIVQYRGIDIVDARILLHDSTANGPRPGSEQSD